MVSRNLDSGNKEEGCWCQVGAVQRRLKQAPAFAGTSWIMKVVEIDALWLPKTLAIMIPLDILLAFQFPFSGLSSKLILFTVCPCSTNFEGQCLLCRETMESMNCAKGLAHSPFWLMKLAWANLSCGFGTYQTHVSIPVIILSKKCGSLSHCSWEVTRNCCTLASLFIRKQNSANFVQIFRPFFLHNAMPSTFKDFTSSVVVLPPRRRSESTHVPHFLYILIA
ncbi:hypothetical protein NPIL_621581 [Nephila pilipes]|uniref:Uncharacterized protein n=1 Tax=Nephila pilipes TaxID=299642 RepID=A0A8X6QZU8_NEPPI|nr:hypothetical protein NPIL_621581 [Nephila pilipes]